jgi:hypothetical protein
VAELLTRASAGITAAAMAAARPVPQPAETALDDGLMPLDPVLYPLGERPVLAPFTGHAVPFSRLVKVLPSAALGGGTQNAPENDEDAARRMRGEGLSYGQIADRLGRSKSWAYNVASGDPVVHANGVAP